MLRHGESSPLYIAAPSLSAQSKAGEPGEMLMGTIRFGSRQSDTVGSGGDPDGWPIGMVIAQPAVPAPKPKSADKDKDDEPGTTERLEEAIAAAQVKHLSKFDHESERDEFDALVAMRLEADPGDLDVLAARMDWVGDDESLDDEARRDATLEAADELIAAIDVESLAAWHGREHDGEIDEEMVAEMDAARSHLIDALRVRASVRLEQAHDGGDEERDAFRASRAELDEWGIPPGKDGWCSLWGGNGCVSGRPPLCN